MRSGPGTRRREGNSRLPHQGDWKLLGHGLLTVARRPTAGLPLRQDRRPSVGPVGGSGDPPTTPRGHYSGFSTTSLRIGPSRASSSSFSALPTLFLSSARSNAPT